MEQKPIESSAPATPPSTPPAGPSTDASAAQPATALQAPSAPASTDQPTQTPPTGTPSGVGSTPPATPPHHSSNAMIYAVITFILVLFGAGIVTYLNNSKPAETTNTTVVAQPTQPPVITVPPTVSPSLSLEEEVETVNVTENESDLQQAENDLQGL